MAAPLILTLGLDPAAFARLDAARRAHFPPARNLIPAHLTLFHALPGEQAEAVCAVLEAEAAATPTFDLDIAGLRFLGRGVAYAAASAPLAALRGRLAGHFAPRLGAQDRQGWRPHVTVQNKVAPELARATLRELEAGFAPWAARGESLLLWRYLGGPWEAAGEFRFAGA
ncbi:2'-5' RNA ligase family protein [Falsiroseomonas sp.]|uniref:2'-5' RNA ligase family protein n=1 Tax=Falsiroseomonas sp. TaxID=2870721 RepID=UPI003564720A